MDNLNNVLKNDTDGMLTYEYIVNNIDSCIDQMEVLTDNLKRVDATGQFLSSSARFLNTAAPDLFEEWIPRLIDLAISKDRDRKYIGSLLEAIWGKDYKERALELQDHDDNFRRIYKRIFPMEDSATSQHII